MEQLSFFDPEEHQNAWGKEEHDKHLGEIRAQVRGLHFARMRADLERAEQSYHDRRNDER